MVRIWVTSVQPVTGCKEHPDRDEQIPVRKESAGPAFIDFLVNFGNLANPDLAFLVFHIKDVVYRPVKMISDIRYLLIQFIQGVAQYPPRPVPMSTSNSCLQAGQVTLMAALPSSLILR